MATHDLMLPGDAFQWRLARNLYPLYRGLGEDCGLAPPCGPLHDGEASPEIVKQVVDWMYRIDDRLAPADFERRLVLNHRANPGATAESLLRHFVTKRDPAQPDVDKADALFLEYFCLYAPPSFHNRRVAKPDVEAVLEPVIRYVPRIQAPSATVIDSLITMVELSSALDGFGIANLTSRTAELRRQVGNQYFARQSVVSFTHLNYTLRRAAQQLQEPQPALPGLPLGMRGYLPHPPPPASPDPEPPGDNAFAFDATEDFCRRNLL